MANAFALRPSRPSMHVANVFSWRKNRKAHPGVCLAPMKSWQFFLKIKSEVLDWSKLISSKTRWFLLVNGDIGSQLEGWLGGNRFGYGQHQLELSSTKPRGYVPALGGGYITVLRLLVKLTFKTFFLSRLCRDMSITGCVYLYSPACLIFSNAFLLHLLVFFFGKLH